MASAPMALPPGAKLVQPAGWGGGIALPPGAKLHATGVDDPYPNFSKIPGFEYVRPAADLANGAGASLAEHAMNAYDLIRKIPGADKILPDSSTFHSFVKDATRDNTPSHVGKFIEGALEFTVPAGKVAGATKGASLAVRAAAHGLTDAAVGAVQSGGDPAATVASALTGAAGPAVGDLAAAGASKFAPALYQSALKPTWAMTKKQGSQMIDTGLGLHIPVSGDGAAALDAHIQGLRDAINAGVDQHAAAGKGIEATKVLESLDGLKDWARKTVDPKSHLETIQRIEDSFIEAHGNQVLPAQSPGAGQIPLDKAQQLKINTYGELKNSYGQMSAVETEAKKQLARGLKEQISSVFPEIAGLNDQQSKAIGLDEALTRAVWRIDNKEMLGIGVPLAAAGGHALMGGPGAAATVIGKILLDNPSLKSKVAIAIGKGGVQNATAVVSSRLGALLKEGTVSALEQPIQQIEQGSAQ